MAVIKQKDVKESLLEQLKLKFSDKAVYQDLVNDYMGLWKVKRQLLADIRQRGVVYDGVSATGVERKMNNQSVKELLGVSRQMLAILKELGLSAPEAVSGEDDPL